MVAQPLLKHALTLTHDSANCVCLPHSNAAHVTVRHQGAGCGWSEHFGHRTWSAFPELTSSKSLGIGMSQNAPASCG